jgi:hypothetical protein
MEEDYNETDPVYTGRRGNNEETIIQICSDSSLVKKALRRHTSLKDGKIDEVKFKVV